MCRGACGRGWAALRFSRAALTHPPACPAYTCLLTTHGEVRQAVDRLGEVEGDGFQGQADIALHHEVQVRPGAVAGIAGAGDKAASVDPLAFAHADRALHQ